MSTIEKIGRVSRASVLKGTAKDWDQWVAILDKAGARLWTHKEIAIFLHQKHKLGMWWRHGVASGYEMHIGRKIEGRNDKGEYSLTATRTFSRKQKDAWRLLMSDEGQAIWLKPFSSFTVKPGNFFETEDGVYGEIRTMKAPERVRLTWCESDSEKKTVVQIYVVARPGEKCLLAITHEKLKNARDRERLRTHWKHVLQQLTEASGQE